MKNKFYKGCALLTVGAALIGSLYAGQADAAAPRKENYATTCQILRDAAASTTALDHCQLHISFSAVNKDDRILYSAHNIIAAYDNGAKSFVEGVVEANTVAAGKETTAIHPYYILRDGDRYNFVVKAGEHWGVLPPLSADFWPVKGDFGLQELFQDTKTAECLNETDKGRTTVFRSDLVPITRIFFSLMPLLPDFDPNYRPKGKLTEVFVRQDHTRGIISDINVDMTQFITGYLKQNPQALTADEQQKTLRKILEKGSVNFHISISNTDKPVEFHDIYKSLYTDFGFDIPQELLSEQQQKDRENGAPVFR